MSHSQFHKYKLLILRHAWLSPLDKHMTTGRINQVSILLSHGSSENAPIPNSFTYVLLKKVSQVGTCFSQSFYPKIKWLVHFTLPFELTSGYCDSKSCAQPFYQPGTFLKRAPLV